MSKLASRISPLILASASPRRAELLRSAGITFVAAPVDCDETWLPDEAPPAYVERVARAKAELALQTGAAAGAAAGAPAGAQADELSLRSGSDEMSAGTGFRVLAADTTVWLEGQAEPLGKPADRAEAGATLARLAGREHFVTTAVVVAEVAEATRWHALAVTTTVWFRPLTAAEIALYLDAGEWRDKAGSYGIQGRAAGMVRRIEGSYTNVVGLPLAEVVELLQGLGAV